MKRRALSCTILLALLAFGAPAWAAKVTICHIPPGNPDNFHTISVSENAVAAHLAHGDYLGSCDQMPFTVTGTGAVTGVTNLPGGLTQVNFSTSGTATHLGSFTGPLTRLQDHHGNFGSTAVIVGANGTDSVFLTVSGHFSSTYGSCVVVTSTGTYTVTGGVGAFANATGSGTISTQIDQCAGTATGTYTGTISRPH